MQSVDKKLFLNYFDKISAKIYFWNNNCSVNKKLKIKKMRKIEINKYLTLKLLEL
jgi:hypothetical protein